MAVEIVRIFDVGDYEAQIARAADTIRAGGIVVLPTETVYGAAGLLGHPEAMPRLNALRGNSAETGSKPFTVHLAHRNDAQIYLGPVNEVGQRLMKKLWPGPVGLMFDVPADRRKQVAEQLNVREADLYSGDTITLRCPDQIVATDVIGRVPGPVVMTAAQVTDGQIDSSIEGKIDLVLDAGPTRYSRPSTILRVKENGYDVVRAGVYDERIIERLLRTTILFVCSGNTCRSPMAEAIARRVIADEMHVTEDDLDKKGISVLSAGAFAMPGARATPQAVEAVKPLGADLTRHRSRPLTVELIHQADMIFTMGRSHASAVTALVPSAIEKTATLDPAGDIDDPIGGELPLYQKLAGELKVLVANRLNEKLLKQ